MATFAKSLLFSGVRILSSRWKPYSRLILIGDNSGWVLDWEMRELRKISIQLGIRPVSRFWNRGSTRQAVFFASQFFLANDNWLKIQHRIGFSYFHGLPNTGDKSFDEIYAKFYRHHEKISRIQVSHSQMRDVLQQTGVSPEKIHLIPIGINLSFFHYRDETLRRQQRARLEIPANAFVIGSFQKDGNGWGEGLEPKLIKGPDIFLQTVEQLKTSIPELFVVLTGPARGYVKQGLERLKIPYRHTFFKDYPDVGKLFPVLDLYLVTSRQEGGPKAILESMASGTPLVTTRVGQAMDIVKHGQNGWMVAVEDVDGLARWAEYVYLNRGSNLDQVLLNGYETAQANSYAKQLPLWKNFMTGFLEWES